MPGPGAAEMTDDPTAAVTAAKYVLLTTFKRKLNGHSLKTTRTIKPKKRPKH